MWSLKTSLRCITVFFCSYPTALEMIASGKVDVKPLVTHTYKLEETLQAFQRAKTGEGGAIKVCECLHVHKGRS